MNTKNVVLITGVAGRIGSALTEKLKNDYTVIGLDILEEGPSSLAAYFKIDLSSPSQLKETLTKIKEQFGPKIHSAVHLAAYYSFTKGHWPEYEKITVRGTKHLLEQLKALFTLDQFIFSSTMLVHAPAAKGVKINEDSPIDAKWNYPKSKIVTEKIIHELHADTSYVIFRIAGVYDDQCHSIPLSHQVQRIYEKQLEGHVFAGNIHHGASFIHMDDLVDALHKAINKQSTLPKEVTLVLGEPQTLSYDTLQRQISKLIWGKEWKTWSLPKPIAKLGAFLKGLIPFTPKGFIQPWMITIADDHYELDITKAEKLLEWHPKHALQDTIPKWIIMLKNDPKGWYQINSLTYKGE